MDDLSRQHTNQSRKSTQSKKSYDFAHDGYRWDNIQGWKRYRVLRPFRGMYWDLKRRIPFYWSDITDGFNYRTMAGTVRIFFVNLLPALAFELDMRRRTDGFFGINEALFSSALAALVFSILAVQPLTVVGITGLISLFNYTIFDITKAQGVEEHYPQILAWVGIWAAITHWLAAIFNLCDYMRYITDFSSNAFGLYVGIIYMIKGIEELIAQFYEDDGGLAGGFLSIVIALCYWATVYFLEYIGQTTMFRPTIRKFLSDYAYPIATIWWTGFSHIPSRITQANLLRVPHTRAFYPTVEHGGPGPWLIDFWNLDAKWVFVALPIGILLTLLFYYDHNVSSLTAQAKQFPLTKPAGFHWDFFLLGCTCFVGAIIGIPLPNGLVPQAPVHTDSCTDYEDQLVLSKEKDDDVDETVIHRKKVIRAVDVKEQRISQFLMALGFVGLMTGPFLDVLHTMPRALFAGVFLMVGWGSIESMQTTSNLLYILRERNFIDPGEPRTRLKKTRIAYYESFRVFGVAASVAISQTIAAIGFPVIIIALIPLRWIVLPRIFTEEELLVLDDPTADADVVLASMGGQPERPEVRMAEQRRQNHGGDGEEGPPSKSSGFSTSPPDSGMRSREAFKDEREREVEEEKEERTQRDGVKTSIHQGYA